MKFKLMHGQHLGEGFKKYHPGDVVESDVDLAQRFGREKFEPVVDDGISDDFGGMTAAELRSHAEDHEYDISGCKTREELLKVIRAENNIFARTSDPA